MKSDKKTLIYLIKKTTQVDAGKYGWIRETSGIEKAYTDHDKACEYIHDVYRKASKDNITSSAQFVDSNMGTYTEYLFEDKNRKVNVRVHYYLSTTELE